MYSYNNFNDIPAEQLPYVMLRGWALQGLCTIIFNRPDWKELLNLPRKDLEVRLLEYACAIPCDITLPFLTENPQALAWITSCLGILLRRLVYDWQMQDIIAEPQLPNVVLPDGREIRCGEPDITGYSLAMEGLINIEIKSGYKKMGKDNGKLARYNGGTHIFAQDKGFDRPFRGTLWVSFTSTRLNRSNGLRSWSVQPVFSCVFEKYDSDRISTQLMRKFGVDVETFGALPRHYNPHPALAG